MTFASRCHNILKPTINLGRATTVVSSTAPPATSAVRVLPANTLRPMAKRMSRSYGSMTYAGLKSFIYAGLTKDDPRVKAAWNWINNNWTLDENPGMKLNSPDVARNGLFYYYHTLTRALKEYGETTVKD